MIKTGDFSRQIVDFVPADVLNVKELLLTVVLITFFEGVLVG